MPTEHAYTRDLFAEEREILLTAKLAGEAIDRGETFKERWLPRGRGLVTARVAAMRLTHTQDERNKHYRNMMSEIMADHGLDRIPKAERDRLFKIMAREAEVVAWYDSLASNQRQKWVNPQTVWNHYEAQRAPPKPELATPRTNFRAEVARLSEENDRLKRAGGSRFDLTRDTADDCITGIIGTVEDGSVSVRKLRQIMNGVLTRLDEIDAKRKGRSAAGS